MTEQLPGLDLEALTRYLTGVAPHLAESPLSARMVVGGKSNLTYMLSTSGGPMVIRRPPLGHVLATAHDMKREYRVMSALDGTAVPVPKTEILCEDPEILGAPFYIMRAVEGDPIKRAAELIPRGAERTALIADRLVTTLANLHSIDPASVGLGDFGRPEGFVLRQINRWKKQLDSSNSRELPGVEGLVTSLIERCPADTGAAIVHGDYRLDNVLVDGNDTITAVLDWEMASLGAPLADLALMVSYDERAKDPRFAGITDVSTAPGYPGTEQVVSRYEQVIGKPIEDFEFYLAFSYFKQVGILEGIHYRYVAGQTVGPGYDTVGEMVLPLLNEAITTLAKS